MDGADELGLPSSRQFVKQPHPYRHQLVGEVEVLVVQRRLVLAGAESEKCTVIVLGEQAEILAPREGPLRLSRAIGR